MQRNSVFHIPKPLPPSHLQINDHCPFLQRDDHGFSPLHWACREGRSAVVEMLIMRGARINVMNRGDDTPLHLAASHGHRDIVQKLLQYKADINAVNEHGNVPLHYACFWGQDQVAEVSTQALSPGMGRKQSLNLSGRFWNPQLIL